MNDEVLERFEEVVETIEMEGFGYAFYEYSNYELITDEEFHIRREAILDARKAMCEYLEQITGNEVDYGL
jgi:hypothetical protein